MNLFKAILMSGFLGENLLVFIDTFTGTVMKLSWEKGMSLSMNLKFSIKDILSLFITLSKEKK